MKSKIHFIKTAMIVVFILIQAGMARSQSMRDITIARLCKNWALVKIEDGAHTQIPDEAQKVYRLFFKNDSTVTQGLSPDGLISGKWTINDSATEITITDDKTKVSYTLRIVRLTINEMVLQQSEQNRLMVIYYKPAG